MVPRPEDDLDARNGDGGADLGQHRGGDAHEDACDEETRPERRRPARVDACRQQQPNACRCIRDSTSSLSPHEIPIKWTSDEVYGTEGGHEVVETGPGPVQRLHTQGAPEATLKTRA